MKKSSKISLGLVAAALLGLLIAVTTAGDDTPTAATPDERTTRLVRPDSQRLSVARDEKVTFVEFLDFECEACRAAYPDIEELRKDYGDRITFVVRYMPLHRNSEAASRAAEAAAEQGKFEDMYHKLFQTQEQWGEKSTSQQDVFFGFAQDMGLDMTRFRTVYDDPATIERVRRDKEDGAAVGVRGTPTFFLNGEKLEVSSFEELLQRVDDALRA
jgi:protein-disulfide isomerase